MERITPRQSLAIQHGRGQRSSVISIGTLVVVFLLIAARRIGRLRIRIWQAMALGALVVLGTGEIAPGAALAAIDGDVMLFLFGMFVVGQALVASGYLYTLAHRVLHWARSTDTLVLALLFAGGFASALLMNDTLAIVGTPLVLRLARDHDIHPPLLVLTLAFAVTTGSVMSPIGNPQNLLVAIGGELTSPFVSFARHLALPTLVSLLLAYGVLRLFFWRHFHGTPLDHAQAPPRDPELARLARWALVSVLAMVLLKVALVALHAPFELRLSYIALLGALPILLGSPRRLDILRHIDWGTLVFFAALFVLMASVWQTGYFQATLVRLHLDLAGLPAVFGVSVLLSQLISNVPLVALYLPLLQHAGAGEVALMALAAGSTIAGNLLILGAASNVIILDAADRRGVHVSFLAFARVGIPLTALQVGVFWWFLS